VYQKDLKLKCQTEGKKCSKRIFASHLLRVFFARKELSLRVIVNECFYNCITNATKNRITNIMGNTNVHQTISKFE